MKKKYRSRSQNNKDKSGNMIITQILFKAQVERKSDFYFIIIFVTIHFF